MCAAAILSKVITPGETGYAGFPPLRLFAAYDYDGMRC
jgi:hypothetical protein